MAAPQDNVHVLTHPLVQSKLSLLRQKSLSFKDFREGINDLTTFLGYESARNLELATYPSVSPVGQFTGSKIKPVVGLAPILRAGIGMTDAMLTLFPEAHVYHIGLFREKISLQPVEYYNKLPQEPNVDVCFVLDPMVATAGTARAALGMILDWGVPIKNVKLLSVLASRAGIDQLKEEYPDLEIYVCAVDDVLTQEGLISPGLGDAGDRLFNTLGQH